MESDYVVFRGGNVIDGINSEPLKNAVLIVKGDKIQYSGPLDSVAIPDRSYQLEISGKTILPGLIDAHLHLLGIKSLDPLDWIVDPPELRGMRAVMDAWRLVERGFTTVRCCGSPNSIFLRKAIEEGSITGPRVVSCGAMITQTGGHGDTVHSLPIDWIQPPRGYGRIADGADECRKAAREQLREGADFIKVCTTGGVTSERDLPTSSQFTIQEIRAIVEEAHNVGVMVSSHAQGTQGIKNALLAGVDTIEHGYYLDDETIEMILERNAYLVPTLSIAEVTLKEGHRANIPETIIKKAQSVHEAQLRSFNMASEAGVNLCCGTDFLGHPICPMGENALEMELQVKAGRSPMDAIISCTAVNAQALNLYDKLGTLEPGKLADLIIVDGDPLQDISILRQKEKIFAVYKGGTRVKSL